MKLLLPVLLGCFSLSSLSVPALRAADEKKEDSATATHNLSEYQIGEVLAGDPVKMEDLKGKVVVLEMWGIHCGPCIASMPGLDAMYKRNKDKGLMIIGLHSQNATDDEVKATVKKLKVKFPITKGGGGPHEGNGIPHSLVFNSEGNLVYEGHPNDAAFEKSVKKALKDVGATASASGSGAKPSGLSTKPASGPAKPAVLVAERPWTNADGKVMNAALISVDGDSAKFKKKDGSTFTYPVSKLNADDQETIKEAAEKAKAETTTSP